MATNNRTQGNQSFKQIESDGWLSTYLPAISAGTVMAVVLFLAVSCSKKSDNVAKIKAPDAPVAANSTTSTMAAAVAPEPPKKIKKHRPANATYVNGTYGVSFSYPRKYSLQAGDTKSVSPVPGGFVKPGAVDSEYPIIVAGRNFGCGSSREHAPIAIGSAGCRVVVAEGFARIFFRNCVATGELYPCETAERLCDALKTGDVVTVDLDRATVTVEGTGRSYPLKPLGDIRPVVDAGGLFNYARQTGMIPAQA